MKNKPLNLNIVREKKEGYLKKTIPINNICNNNCLFCFAHYNKNKDDIEDYDFVMQEIKKSASQKTNFLALSGYGEPTISKNIIKYIKFANLLGIPNIAITTNGRMLSNEKYLKKIVSSGLNGLLISIHSDKSEVHDFLTRCPGSFEQTLKGIRNSVKLKEKYNLKITLDVVVNKHNYKRLAETVRFLDSLGVDIIHISRADPIGNAYTNYTILKVSSEKIIPELKRLVSNVYNSKITLLFPLKELYFIDNLSNYVAMTSFEDKSFFEISEKICIHHQKKEIYFKKFEECKECNMEIICDNLREMKQNIEQNKFIDCLIEAEKPSDLNFKSNLPALIRIKKFTDDMIKDIIERLKESDSIEIDADSIKKTNSKIKKTNLIINIKDGLLDGINKINKFAEGNITLKVSLTRKNIDELRNAELRERFLEFSRGMKIILNFEVENAKLKKFDCNLKDAENVIKKIFEEKNKDQEIIILNIPYCYLNKKIHRYVYHKKFTDTYNPLKMDLANKTFDKKYFFRMFNKEARAKKHTCKECSMNHKCMGEFMNYVREYGFNKDIVF